MAKRTAEEYVAEATRLVEDVEDEVVLPVHVTGLAALDAVLCVFCQRIDSAEAADVLGALPEPVQPPRCQHHHGAHAGRPGREGFVERVAEHLQTSNEEAETITRAVFAVLPRWLPAKDIAGVARRLPVELRPP